MWLNVSKKYCLSHTQTRQTWFFFFISICLSSCIITLESLENEVPKNVDIQRMPPFFCTTECRTPQNDNFLLQSGMKQWKISEALFLWNMVLKNKTKNHWCVTSPGLTWAGGVCGNIQTGGGGGYTQENPHCDNKPSCGIVMRSNFHVW